MAYDPYYLPQAQSNVFKSAQGNIERLAGGIGSIAKGYSDNQATQEKNDKDASQLYDIRNVLINGFKENGLDTSQIEAINPDMWIGNAQGYAVALEKAMTPQQIKILQGEVAKGNTPQAGIPTTVAPDISQLPDTAEAAQSTMMPGADTAPVIYPKTNISSDGTDGYKRRIESYYPLDYANSNTPIQTPDGVMYPTRDRGMTVDPDTGKPLPYTQKDSSSLPPQAPERTLKFASQILGSNVTDKTPSVQGEQGLQIRGQSQGFEIPSMPQTRGAQTVFPPSLDVRRQQDSAQFTPQAPVQQAPQQVQPQSVAIPQIENETKQLLAQHVASGKPSFEAASIIDNEYQKKIDWANKAAQAGILSPQEYYKNVLDAETTRGKSATMITNLQKAQEDNAAKIAALTQKQQFTADQNQQNREWKSGESEADRATREKNARVMAQTARDRIDKTTEPEAKDAAEVVWNGRIAAAKNSRERNNLKFGGSIAKMYPNADDVEFVKLADKWTSAASAEADKIKELGNPSNQIFSKVKSVSDKLRSAGASPAQINKARAATAKSAWIASGGATMTADLISEVVGNGYTLADISSYLP